MSSLLFGSITLECARVVKTEISNNYHCWLIKYTMHYLHHWRHDWHYWWAVYYGVNKQSVQFTSLHHNTYSGIHNLKHILCAHWALSVVCSHCEDSSVPSLAYPEFSVTSDSGRHDNTLTNQWVQACCNNLEVTLDTRHIHKANLLLQQFNKVAGNTSHSQIVT